MKTIVVENKTVALNWFTKSVDDLNWEKPWVITVKAYRKKGAFRRTLFISCGSPPYRTIPATTKVMYTKPIAGSFLSGKKKTCPAVCPIGIERIPQKPTRQNLTNFLRRYIYMRMSFWGSGCHIQTTSILRHLLNGTNILAKERKSNILNNGGTMKYDDVVLKEIANLEEKIELLKQTNEEYVLIGEYLKESGRSDHVWNCASAPRVEFDEKSISGEGFKKALTFFHKKGYHILDKSSGKATGGEYLVWHLRNKDRKDIYLSLNFSLEDNNA